MSWEGTFLVDTNSYVRIAQNSTCVLGNHGGLELRLVAEIAAECARSPRLRALKHWILEPPHPEHRQEWTLQLEQRDSKLVREAKDELKSALPDALADFSSKRAARGDLRPVLSGPDKALFFTAFALGLGVVTDEGPLTYACKEFDVAALSTLELLRHLETSGVLVRPHIEAMVRYWQFEKDTPQGWKAQYRNLFGVPPPLYQP